MTLEVRVLAAELASVMGVSFRYLAGNGRQASYGCIDQLSTWSGNSNWPTTHRWGIVYPGQQVCGSCRSRGNAIVWSRS